MSPLISIFKCIPFQQPGFIPPSAGQFQMEPDRQFQLTLPMTKQDGLDSYSNQRSKQICPIQLINLFKPLVGKYPFIG